MLSIIYDFILNLGMLGFTNAEKKLIKLRSM